MTNARLLPETHALAERALSGEHGRGMREAGVRLEDHVDRSKLSDNMQYAHAIRLIAEHAPLRVIEGERVVGSATLVEATWHQTPVMRNGSTSHTTLGFDRALKIGYAGLRAQVEARLARGGLDERGEDLLRSMLMCLEAAGRWHRRHIALLEERIAASAGAVRAGYARVLASLKRVPEHPPETFAEAVQALWMMYAFQRLCGNWSGIGRIDQMLGPFLEKDLAEGRLTLDEARELLAHFWIKGCEWIDGRSRNGTGDAQFYQNIILSGIDAGGRDVTNDVTYLVLDVVEELGISDFPIAVRISERTPDRLLRRIAEVQRLGGGIIAVYGEDVAVRALTRFGYPLPEAREFANDGCWELLVPGRTRFGYVPIDVFALLQETLGVTGDGPPAAFGDFEALYAAYRARLGRALDEFQVRADAITSQPVAAPLVSLMVEDCIERAKGYYEGGPRYSVLAPHAGGLQDAANSLLAIRRMVYEDRALALAEFVDVLRRDWKGREELRLRVRSRGAFYGNDDPTADAMVRRLFDDFTALAGRVRERGGVLRPPGLSTFGRQIEWAPKRGAAAHGARRGEYLANNFSPTPGTDLAGPTAVIKSFCAMDFEKLPSGTALDLKIHPSGVAGEAGLDVLVSLLKSFASLGGIFMQVDVVDSRLLREAQEHPERHANLAVRISGWSARFVTLDRHWQDMIIRRTEHDVHAAR